MVSPACCNHRTTSLPPNATFRTQEACRLLKLLPGSAKLIEEMLEPLQQATVDTDVYSAAITALSDVGVHTLEPLQALKILMLRVEPA